MDTRAIRRDNLRLLSEKYGGQRALAEAANLTPNQLNHIIGPNPVRNLGEQLARRIEANLKLPQGYLDLPHQTEDTNFSHASSLIPIVDIVGEESDGSYKIVLLNEGIMTKQWAVERNLDPNNLFQYEMSDENMYPNILKGDSLIVDTKKKNITNSGVYVFFNNGIVSIKRFFFLLGNDVKIANDSADKTLYPDITTSQENLSLIEIIGQVVAIQRNLPS